MSDEEKKAIEIIKYLQYKCIEENGTGMMPLYKLDDLANAIKILINLIEKQSKKIEELKQIKSKLDEKNIPIETLLAEFERLEDLEDDLTTVYLNGVYDGEKKVEDKIKTKIEDLKENSNGDDFNLTNVIMILQSLLEKE